MKDCLLLFVVHDFNNIILVCMRLVNIRIQNKSTINIVNSLPYYGVKHSWKYQYRRVMADVYLIRQLRIVLTIGFKMLLNNSFN